MNHKDQTGGALLIIMVAAGVLGILMLIYLTQVEQTKNLAVRMAVDNRGQEMADYINFNIDCRKTLDTISDKSKTKEIIPTDTKGRQFLFDTTRSGGLLFKGHRYVTEWAGAANEQHLRVRVIPPATSLLKSWIVRDDNSNHYIFCEG